MLYWLRQAGVVLVIWIAVLVFPNVKETPARLWAMYEEFWSRSDKVLTDWQTPLAGEEPLADKVQAMLAMLRDTRISTFQFSPGIAADPDASVLQRLAEAAYPIRFRQDATDLLQLASEPLHPRCKEVARKLEIILARCP